jgi:glycerophosphoryl diester phosphodiesterase
VHKDMIGPRDPHERLAAPTGLVADAQAAGLAVHARTFRAENAFLPAEFRSGADRADTGDLHGELAVFLRTGVDGVFTDQPDLAASLL